MGEVDLLHGGPPCTPFSKSGYWLAYKRAGADPKASLLDNYVDALCAIRPKAFLMENVYGLAYQNQNRAILTRFIKNIREAGYSFDSRIVLAADHGVPQLRQRLFCAGIRRDLLDMPTEDWEARLAVRHARRPARAARRLGQRAAATRHRRRGARWTHPQAEPA